MKRAARIAGLLLLAGALINVAVAWGVAVSVDDSNADEWTIAHDTLRVGDLNLEVATLSRPGSQIVAWAGPVTVVWPTGSPPPGYLERRDPEGLVPAWSRLEQVVDAARSDSLVEAVDIARGWPMLALRCGLDLREPLPTWPLASGWQPGNGRVVAGIPIGSLPAGAVRGQRILPLRPIWTGFLVNTLIYAAALWVLLRTPRVIRRTVRRRCGCCVGCAYDLRGGAHEACPECGRPVPPTC